MKDELDAARRTRRQLLEERQKLTQDCAEWALRVSDVKTMVLNGLGKNPRKYCIEIIDECTQENWDSLVVVKKRKRSLGSTFEKPQQESIVVPYKMSEIAPRVNGIIEKCLDQMVVDNKEPNSFIGIKEEVIVDHDEVEETCYHNQEIMPKEEILEIELPSHI